MKCLANHTKTCLKNSKKNSKCSYYQDKLKKCEGNIKSTWKIIKKIVGKAKIKAKTTCNTDKTEIANNFNEFFASVGPKFAEEIPYVNKKLNPTFL